MVTISSPGLSSADVTDAVGSTANDGLTFDSATNDLDVDVGGGLTITPNGKVDIPSGSVGETAVAYDFVGVPQMVDATVDNTPVTVLLTDNESYTPSTGSVQKVTVTVVRGEELELATGGSSAKVVDDSNTGSEPNAESVEMVITGSETLTELGATGGGGIYISGFEVS